MSALPEGWFCTELSEVLSEIRGGGTPSKIIPEYFNGNIPFMTVKDMKTLYPENTIDKISIDALNNSSANLIPSDSIIISTRMGLGKICRVSFETAINQDLKALFINDAISKNFLFYWYQGKSSLIQSLGKGTTVKGIRLEALNSLSLNLPPVNEQIRITEKLDQIFGEVNNAKTRLDKIPVILKNFRKSLINQCIGKFNSNKNIETIDLQSICYSISDGDHQAPPKTDKGIPFLVISNITKGFVDLDGVTRFVSEEYYNNLKDIRTPKRGDILYSVTGSIGIPVVVETDEKFCFQRHIAVIKPKNELVLSKFLQYYLKSSFIYKQAKSVSTGTAQITVPLRGLRRFQLKVPPLHIQKEIVDMLDASLELADQIEEKYNLAMGSVDKIAQSILAKAFQGELVPQDPNDEPASILLEKIKAEKELEALKPKKKSRKPPRKTKEVMKMISSVLDTLKKEKKPLTAQVLLEKSGYPVDSDPEKIEEFFLDIKDSLNEGTIVRERIKNEDIFKLAI